MANILIVDDDDGLRFLIGGFLEGLGYDCTLAADVTQACNHLKEKNYEVAISDFNMPCESGLDLLEYVVSRSPSTSFILMSGDSDGDVRRKAIEMGAAGYMAKPFRLKELLSWVENALHPESSAQCYA